LASDSVTEETFLISVPAFVAGTVLSLDDIAGSFGMGQVATDEAGGVEDVDGEVLDAALLSRRGVLGSLFRFFLFLFTTTVNPSFVSIVVVEEDDGRSV
jgi:hypothetical protein